MHMEIQQTFYVLYAIRRETFAVQFYFISA